MARYVRNSEGLELKRCTKKRCMVPHSWWSRLRRRYYWCA